MTSYLSGIQVTKNGYLLLPEHDDQGNEPLVLESADQLWFKLHPQHDEIIFHDEASNVQIEIETQAPPSLENLQRFFDMSNKVVPVIEDIVKMQDRERFLSRTQREKRVQRIHRAERLNHSKVQSLERQQEAHQKLSISEDDSAMDISISDTHYFLNAAVRVVKTLNSIRLIFPLIINMLNHDLRDDKELVISGNTLGKGGAGSRGKQWMFGDYIYDIISVKNVLLIKRQMELVFLPLLKDDEIKEVLKGTTEWNTLLPRLLSKCKVPENPPTLLKLSEDRLREARKHDEAVMRLIEEGRACSYSDSSFSKAVDKLKEKFEIVLGKRFKGCRLEVYGSCLSDLSLGKASDVDVSIYIPKLQEAKIQFETGKLNATKYAAEVKKYVFAVQRRLSDFSNDFSSTVAVPRARVPVVKGCYLHADNPHTKDGSLAFDICFFNDIAVRNSTLLREYTLVDPRAKNLMLMVKKWAKDHRVSCAASDRLSSYAWIVLVIFYLQQIGMLPNLQCKDLMKRSGFEPDTSNPSNCINALDTTFVPWDILKVRKAWHPREELNDVPISVLLHGFFHYMAFDFPLAFYAISIRINFMMVPKPVFNRCYPFETFDSHCPHDLGGPANSQGQEFILFLLSDSAKCIRSMLTGEQKADGAALGSYPTQPYLENAINENVQPSSKDNKSKNGKSKRKERKPHNVTQGRAPRNEKNSEQRSEPSVSSLKRAARRKASRDEKNSGQESGQSNQGAVKGKTPRNRANSSQRSGRPPSKRDGRVENSGKRKKNDKNKGQQERHWVENADSISL